MAGGYFRISTENTEIRKVMYSDQSLDILSFKRPNPITFDSSEQITDTVNKVIMIDSGVKIPFVDQGSGNKYTVEIIYPIFFESAIFTGSQIEYQINGMLHFFIRNEQGEIIDPDPSVTGMTFFIKPFPPENLVVMNASFSMD